MKRFILLIAFGLTFLNCNFAQTAKPLSDADGGKLTTSVDGKLVFEGKTIELRHAYARGSYSDFFDESKQVMVYFMEKPIEEQSFEGANVETFRRLKQAGNNYVVGCEVTGKHFTNTVWDLSKLSDAQPSVLPISIDLFFIEYDILKLDDQTVEGKVYTKKEIVNKGNLQVVHGKTLEVSFRVAIRMRDSLANDPVTSHNGTRLPIGGGAPGTAYLEIAKLMKAAKGVKELAAVIIASRNADLAESMKPTAGAIQMNKELEESLATMLKKTFIIDNPTVEGGFISGNKATLQIKGTQEGVNVTARLNMHLENDRWKTGKGEIRFVQ
jgi:hypothetical protein